jgi:hypothetical protein
MVKSFWMVGALLTGVIAGCGTIGPPMAPEDIGLAARLRAEEEKASKAVVKPEEEVVGEVDETELAPLYPIGTR